MIYKCSCGTVWTRVQTLRAYDTTKLPTQTCPDCVGFEWTKYDAGVAYAKSLKLNG